MKRRETLCKESALPPVLKLRMSRYTVQSIAPVPAIVAPSIDAVLGGTGMSGQVLAVSISENPGKFNRDGQKMSAAHQCFNFPEGVL